MIRAGGVINQGPQKHGNICSRYALHGADSKECFGRKSEYIQSVDAIASELPIPPQMNVALMQFSYF